MKSSFDSMFIDIKNMQIIKCIVVEVCLFLSRDLDQKDLQLVQHSLTGEAVSAWLQQQLYIAWQVWVFPSALQNQASQEHCKARQTHIWA